MSEERKAQLSVTVNPTEAKEGLGEIKREAQSMAQTVADAGKDAGRALDGLGASAKRAGEKASAPLTTIGGEGEKSSRKIDAATKSMIQSIQRTTAVMEAGSKTSSKYYETLAAQRGVDVNALKPYLAQLDAVAAKQKTAEQALRATDPALKSVGVSAAQTAAAMRQIPGQMSDIVTSLQAGQAPMTVLLQQGGQLKDAFGGVGPAARAMTGYIAGMINPLTLAAAAAAGLGFAVAKLEGSDRVFAGISTSLRVTGRETVGTTAQLREMVYQLSLLPGMSKSAAEATVAEFAKTRQIGAGLFKELAESVSAYARATGQEAAEAAKDLARAFADPAAGAKSLDAAFGSLSNSSTIIIERLTKQGDVVGAQKVLLVELQKALKGVHEEGMTPLQTATDDFAKAWKEANHQLDASNGLRTVNNGLVKIVDSFTWLINNSASVASALEKAMPPQFRLYHEALSTWANAGQPHAKQSSSGKISYATPPTSGAETDVEKEVKAALALGAAYQTTAGRMQEMRGISTVLSDAMKKLSAAGREGSEEYKKLRDQLAGVNEAIKDAGKGDASKVTNELKEQNKLMLELAGLNGTFSEDWERLNALRAKGAITTGQLVEMQAKLLKQQPAIKANIEAEAKAAEALAYEMDEAAKARAADVDRSYKATLASIKLVNDYGRAIDDNNKMTEYEVSLLGKTEEQRNIAVEQYRIQLELQREIQRLDELGLDAAEKRQRIEQLNAAAARASDGAARRVWLNEWKKINDDVGRSLTDALMQGGKSAGEYLKNYFKSLVFRPVIQAIMAPVSGALATAFAPSTAMAAGAAGGGSSAMSWISAGKSMWDGFSTGFAGLSESFGAYVMDFGNMIGSTSVNQFGAGMAGVNTGTTAGSAGSMAGTAAGYAAGIAGGVYGGRMISSGYSLNGGSGNSTVNAGTAIGAAVGSIVPVIGTALGALVGGLLGGVVNRAFGHGPKKVQSFGFEGEFDADSFMGGNFQNWKQEGGWFRSDKKGTQVSAMNAAMMAQLSGGVAALSGQTKAWAETLGLSASAVDGYSKHIRLTLTKDEAENQRLITELFSGIGEEMAKMVGDVSGFAKTGETTSQTLQRLSTSITTVNHWMSMLRQRMFQVSAAGGDAAAKLADAFGGLENLTAASAAFYQTYFSESERAARSIEDMKKALGEVNVELPKTMAELRNMASSLDLNTESGRKAYAVLLAIAPEFANVAEATSRMAKETAQKLIATFTANGDLIPALDQVLGSTGLFAQGAGNLATTLDMSKVQMAALATGFSEAQVRALALSASTGNAAAGMSAAELAAVALATGMSAAQVKAGALVGALTSMGDAAGSISVLFLDAGSGLVNFTNATTGTTSALTAAQAASLGLGDQINALRMNAQGATIDMQGLSVALANVNTETFVETLAMVFENLAGRISDTIGSIADERIAVREGAQQIMNPTVMSKDAIAAQIASINTSLPSNAGVVAALAAQNAAYAQQSSVEAYKQSIVSTYAPGVDAALNAANQARAQSDSALNAYRSVVGGFRSWDSLSNKEKTKVMNGQALPTGGYQRSDFYVVDENFGAGVKYRAGGYVTAGETTNQNNAAYGQYSSAFDAAQAALAAYNSKAAFLAQKMNEIAAQQSQAAANVNSANAQAKAAQLAYTDALQNFALDASKSVSKLSNLRAETLKYYEAQKQLANLMTSSAANLRQTVADYRYGQMSPEQQFAQLQTQFSTAYAMALSTDGEALAGYGDKLNNLLNPLLEKAREVYGSGADFNVFAASVLARAENVAGRIEQLTPTNYAAESLVLLGQIDSTLAALDASSKSAEQLIVNAINAGRDQTVGGLRAVVAALTGKSIPAFAAGGYHTGGLRLVGENGPELEATGPARIFNAAQTREILSGGGDTAAEIRMLRAENRALSADLRTALEAIASYTNKTAKGVGQIVDDGLTINNETSAPIPVTASKAIPVSSPEPLTVITVTEGA